MTTQRYSSICELQQLSWQGGAGSDENLSESESESSDSEDGEDGIEGYWEDDEEDEDKMPARKWTKKLLSCVEMVCRSRSCLVLQY